MTSQGDFGQLTGPRWLSATLIVVAVVALVATGASFLWIMSEKEAHSTESDFVQPDPRVLETLEIPAGFTSVRDVPACVESETSRCFLTTKSADEVVQVAAGLIDVEVAKSSESPFGYTGYQWCGTHDGDVVYVQAAPNITNAKHQGPGSWGYAKEPEFDDRWVLTIVLAESRTCE